MMSRVTWFFSALLLQAGVSHAAEPDYSRYLASTEDFGAIEEGISDATAVQPELFPKGIGDVDVLLYDAHSVLLWTRTKRDLQGERRWNAYFVYRIAHGATMNRDNMHVCRSGTSEFLRKALGERNVAKFAFECAPMGTVTAYHSVRGRLYDTRESYLATVIHEYAHQYLERQRGRVPVAETIREKTESLTTPFSRRSIWHEAFAIWCELRASRRLYPAFFERLRSHSTADHRSEHDYGQEIALELIDHP